jgi:hypothetical protein
MREFDIPAYVPMLNRLNKLFEKEYFPIIFRIITLLSFIALVCIGFSGSRMNIKFLRMLSLTNLTTSFVWRIWWPLIILSAILIGRVWCMVCPVEIITSFFARAGLKRKRPAWLTSGWVITILYGIIVIAGITIAEIDRIPKYTSMYLLSIIGISIAAGLIFEKNTFCRYVCPVGYLLGIFSKLASWGWRVKNRELCGTCPDKSCIRSAYTYKISSKSCGVGLFPANIENNDQCLLCGGCLKTCRANSNGDHGRPNPSLVRIGFAQGLTASGPLLFAECVFMFLLSAHLIDEISEYSIISDLVSSIGQGSLMNFSGLTPGLHKNILASILLFAALPVLLWFVPYIILAFKSIKISVKDYLKSFSIALIPVIAGIFTGLIIMEIVTRFPYYKYILQDPLGIDTTRGIITRQIIIPPASDIHEWGLFVVMIAATLAGVFLSFKIIRKQNQRLNLHDSALPVLLALPVIFVLVFFAEVIVYRAF